MSQCTHVAYVLEGPATTPIHNNTKAVHSAPQCNQKGSINKSGGGGGGGSGCGKKSPCDKSKKKSKSCGGGGGGCGGSKSCGGRKVTFKVCFKDYYGNVVPVDGKNTQDVEKDSTAKFPTPEEQKVPHPDTKTFSTWEPYPAGVNCDMECKSIWYDKIKEEEESGASGTDVIPNKVSEDVGQKIQNFNDSYLSPGTTSKSIRSVSTKGKFNIAIDTMINRINYITNVINNAMDTLWEIRETCYEGPDKNAVFNDTKKCILNIQSCFIFQTRMSFNLDFRWSMMKDGVLVENTDVPKGTPECVYDKIMRYTQQLMDLVREGKEDQLDDKIKEYQEELDEDIDFYLENNEIAFNEFKDSYNTYVDTINSCFPTDPLEKI